MNKRRSSKGRKLVVLGRIWFWRLSGGQVVITNDQDQVFREDEDFIVGMDFYSAQRAKEKRYFSVTPKMVADFIELRLNENEVDKPQRREERGRTVRWPGSIGG
jgi:hypothetical protein